MIGSLIGLGIGIAVALAIYWRNERAAMRRFDARMDAVMGNLLRDIQTLKQRKQPTKGSVEP